MASSPASSRALQRARVDFPPSPRPPTTASVVAATIFAIAGSLAADAALVAIGEAIFPATRGFTHFRFADYASLTLIGVIAACASWPVVTRVSSSPRWLLSRMAVAVTVVLWIPDLWILVGGEPAQAVAVLMVMHLAIAVVTFYALVAVAPAAAPLASDATSSPSGVADTSASTNADRRADTDMHAGAGSYQRIGTPAPLGGGSATGSGASRNQSLPSEPAGHQRTSANYQTSSSTTRWQNLMSGRAVWATMITLLTAELVLGVVAIVTVPVSRPAGWLPHQGQLIYLGHAAVGMALGFGAIALVGGTRRRGVACSRDVRLAATMGIVGIAVAGAGGLLCVEHGMARLIGMGLMLAGTMIAALGYVLPLIGPPAPATALPGTPEPPAPAGQPDHPPAT